MLELVLILLTIVFVAFIVKRKTPTPAPKLERAPIIEDSSHLKAELAATQEKLAKLNQELGQLQSNLKLSQNKNIENAHTILDLQAKFDKLQHQKKSSEVKTGFLAESLLPLTSQFPCDPKTMRFLGSPIDFVSFDYDKMEITFIECKTGESQLNDNQRKVKKMVNEGKVKFVEVRLNENGVNVK